MKFEKVLAVMSDALRKYDGEILSVSGEKGKLVVKAKAFKGDSKITFEYHGKDLSGKRSLYAFGLLFENCVVFLPYKDVKAILSVKGKTKNFVVEGKNGASDKVLITVQVVGSSYEKFAVEVRGDKSRKKKAREVLDYVVNLLSEV